MNVTLSRPVRRIVAVGLLAAVILLLWRAVVAPLANGYADDLDTIARLQQSLNRASNQQQTIAYLEHELTRLKKNPEAAAGLLAGTNPSIVAAQLQERLRVLVDRSHGELRRAQVLPATDVGKFRRIAVRADVVLSLAGLQQVIYDLEAASPYLFVDNLDVKHHQIGQDSDHPEQESGHPDQRFDVNLDLSGYLRRPL